MSPLLCDEIDCIGYLNGICKLYAKQPPTRQDGVCGKYRQHWVPTVRKFNVGDVVLRVYDVGPNRLGTVVRKETLNSEGLYWVRRDDTGQVLDYFGDELLLASTPVENRPYWMQERG